MAYRSKVSSLTVWCKDKNLCLNVEKVKYMVDFRRVPTSHAPLSINGAAVEKVSSTMFLGVHTQKTSPGIPTPHHWSKKLLYFLWKMRRARAPTPIMHTFYRRDRVAVVTPPRLS